MEFAPDLKSAGFQISLWPYPHVWPYILNTTESSVFHDKRLRKALNYAIDRDAIAKFLNGTAKPAYGVYPPDNPDFGKPEQRYGYDPDKAKQLLKEAGYGPDHPVKAKVMHAVQQPLAGSALEETMGAPAWKSLPSWYLVAANDEAIPPNAERQFAARMEATTVEVPSGHVAMVSRPDDVTELIQSAARTAPVAA